LTARFGKTFVACLQGGHPELFPGQESREQSTKVRTTKKSSQIGLDEVLAKDSRRKAIASDLLAQEEESNSEEETPKYVN
jgi:hypothetical protein